MTEITAEWCRERGACYPDTRLAKLFDRPHTLREVMTRTDGRWASVPARDRVWVACRALPARQARLFACKVAERALLRERDAGREPHPDSWVAIEVSRRHADGLATDEELWAAATAASARTVTTVSARTRAVEIARTTATATAARTAAAAASQMAKTAARTAVMEAANAALAAETAYRREVSPTPAAGVAVAEEYIAQVADVLAVLDEMEQ